MKKPTLISRFAVLVATTAIAGKAVAHHGAANEPLYDMSQIREFDGIVTDVFWRNPHARFRFRVLGGEEDGEIWEVETNPVGILLRTGFTPDLIPVGSEVKVAGVASRRRPRQMELYNVLLPNGLEFADAARPKPLRYSDQRLNLEQVQANQAAVDAAVREADGIFRVWGRDRTSLGRFADESMLTEAAKAAKAAFDPRTDLPHLDCIPPGMPTGMMIPEPLPVHRSGRHDRASRPGVRSASHDSHERRRRARYAAGKPPLGYSVGRWEGDTLVVTNDSHRLAEFRSQRRAAKPRCDAHRALYSRARWTIHGL